MNVISSLLLYIFVASIVAFFLYWAQKKEDKRWIWIAIIVLSMVAGLRAENVGVDTASNIKTFQNCYEKGFIFVTREYGFYSLVILLMKIFPHPNFVFGVFGIMIYSLILFRLWDFRKLMNLGTASFLFVLYYFGQSLNVTRQYIAIAIVFWATRYLKKKNYIKYLLLVVLAFQFHISSCMGVVFLLLYLDREEINKIREKYTKKQIKQGLIIGGCLCLAMLLLLVVKYSSYFARIKSIDLGIMMWVRLFILIGSYCYVRRKRVSDILKHAFEDKESLEFFWSITLLGTMFGLGNVFLDNISRLGYCFKIFELIYYPMLLKQMCGKKLFKAAIVFILVVLGIYNLYAYAGIIPYRMFMFD